MIDNNRFCIRLEIVAATTTFIWLKYTSYINFLIKFAAILVRRLTHRNGQNIQVKIHGYLTAFIQVIQSV